MKKRILIVDDDPTVQISLSLLLKQNGFLSDALENPDRAVELLAQKRYDLMLQDMNFSRKTTGEEGIALLRQVKAKYPHLPVILITAWGSISLAVAGVRYGASDFITKPWSNEQLIQSVKTALGLAEIHSKQDHARPLTRSGLEKRYDFQGIVGEDPELLKILDITGRVASTDASVLIVGESGTGKELIAEALYRNSTRKDGPFVKVNLGGISSALFESEMFGHVRGAYTDARQGRKGRFEMADGGTIFLDEVGDLEAECQVKLLRVLQDREYEVLGSSMTRTVDVRVISATNRNLPEMIDSGKFREDLLYRLNLIALHVPPLRDRQGDIPLLVYRFLDDMAKLYRRHGLTISDPGMEWIKRQSFPGNVRELKQLIQRTVLVTNTLVMEPDDLQWAVSMVPAENPRDKLPDVGSITLEEMERSMIEKALTHYGNNVGKASKALGISRASLYRRLDKYGFKI